MTSRGILGTIALAAFALVVCAAPASALSPHSPVFTDPGQPAAVQAGEEFFIALPSNETTGYTWTQSLADGKIVAYEGNVYQGPSKALPGGGGQQIFIYHANRSGSTSLTFRYARPFEPGEAPAKTLTFDVTVQ
jgi:predicted secreted protein